MTKTQTSDILQHLKDGRRLTQKEAINEYGAYRLSAIIYSLRNQGYEIASIPLSVPTRYNTKKGEPRMANIVEYKLDDNWNNFKEDYSKAKTKQFDEAIGFDRRLMDFLNKITE